MHTYMLSYNIRMHPIVQSPLITEQYVGKVVIGMVDDDARACVCVCHHGTCFLS